MKQQKLKLLLALTAFVGVMDASDCCSTACSSSSVSTSNKNCAQSKNTWLPRSFGAYQSRMIILEKSVFENEAIEHERHEWTGDWSFATEYMQNFGKCNNNCNNVTLGTMPFWSGTNSMTIGNNDEKANIDAYQFGLGNVTVDATTGLAGTIQLNPRIQHVGTEVMLYLRHYEDKEGVYFKVNIPVGAMSVDPKLTEPTTSNPDGEILFTQTTATTSTPIAYSWLAYPSPGRRYTSMADAFYGGYLVNGLDGNDSNPIRLEKGRIAPCKRTAIRVGDLSATMGYNVYVKEKGFLGVGVKASFPTGNVPKCDYMLEPIFGRAGAYTLGGELMGHYKAWSNDDETKHIHLFLQGEVLHLFTGRKPNYRSFDLKLNGAGSKYLLLQDYRAGYNSAENSDLGQPYGLSQVVAGHHLTQAVNITTLPVLSKFAVEGAVAAMVDFRCNNVNFGVGAEFWGRSKECLSIDLCSARHERFENLNDFAVVGRQVNIYNVVQSGNPLANLAATQSVFANYCEPLAKINKSQNPVTLVGNPGASPSTLTTPTTPPDGIKDATVAANRIPAVLTDALDIAGAAANQAMTGKVFGQFGYTWTDHRFTPSLSLIGGAEFTSGNNNAINLWSAGLSGSMNF